MSDGV